MEATKGMVHAMNKNVWRAVIEVGFIIFIVLFQSFDGRI
jgi:hypothetical protein